MVIENRDLAVGTKLIAKYKDEQWKIEVLPGEPRTFGFVGKRPKDAAELYKSPSSAGSAVMGVPPATAGASGRSRERPS